MINIQNILTRSTAITSAAVLAAAATVPVVLSMTAGAAQVTDRSIKMSDSQTSATGVTYEVTFTPSATSVQSLVLDFCDDASTPIIGDACVQTAGTVPDLTSATVTAGSGMGAWTASAGADGHVVLSGTAVASATAQTITLQNVDNPSDLGTFYARVTTYAAAAPATDGYTGPTVPGTYVDNGGFALSTADDVVVTARVHETISFSIANTNVNIPASDQALVENSVLEGDVQPVISVSTNAVNGLDINLWGNPTGSDNYNGTLARGSHTDAGSGAAANFTIDHSGNIGAGCQTFPTATSTEYFGVQTEVTTGSNVTVDANYACALASSTGAWDNAVGSLYGDTVASSSGVIDSNEVTLDFGAKAATTTEAGIYSTNLSYIAVGKY